jgi:quinoprotein glucose dehydrogenase
MSFIRCLSVTLLFAFLGEGVSHAAEAAPVAKTKNAGSLVDDPEVALRKFTVAPGLKVDLFAAEPDVRNPVALSIDERGRVFVVESDRRRSSVFDIRGHKDWLEADFSFRTVGERAEFLKQQVSPTNPAVIKRLTGSGGNGSFADFNKDGVIDWRDLEVQTERIRLLEDTNGDGRADRASIFADDFTNIVAGVAAGVLAQGGDVYFACIPDLWRMTNDASRFTIPASDSSRVKRKTENVKLLTGFGVHIAFGGHDMHGLIFGPDGKLYWSIADRGTDTNLFAKIKNPIPGLTPELVADSGCIFRANRDGSDFEVVAWGLRNPQELAFDDYGNLFTADNNGDGGDKARWHYVVEGADFGWRIGWQWLEARAYQPKMGPWNGERLWHLAESNTAAYLLPPLAHIGHGPAGLAYNPGTGLPAQFDHHFFLCDFPGHVLTWTNIPDGASFKVGPVQNFFGDLGPTDVAFHPDGGVLVSDWFKSFDKSDKGRIYRIHDPATDASQAVQETKHLLAEGMAKRGVKELVELLGHRDMRVRLEAQWELAGRVKSERDSEFKALVTVALRTGETIPRLHALWAMGSIARRLDDAQMLDDLRKLLSLLQDSDSRIRAEACSLFQQAALLSAKPFIANLLKDPDQMVRSRAAQALSKPFALTQGYRLLQSLDERVGDSVLPKLDELKNRITGGTTIRGTKSWSWSWPNAELEQLLADAGANRDSYLRHAAFRMLLHEWTFGLPQGASLPARVFPGNYRPFVTNVNRHVRMGALLVLRMYGDTDVARFLSDPDPQLVLEAARAINDVPIPAAYPQLAALLSLGQSEIGDLKSEITFFTLRRALNASFRLGHATNAQALANFAARIDVPEPLRIEALELLSEWPKPPARDHFMGLYRPLPPRDVQPAADALRPVLAFLLRDSNKDVKLAAFRASDSLSLDEVDRAGLVADPTQPAELRVEALKSLAKRKDARLGDALKTALADSSEALRMEATRLQGGAGDVGRLAGLLESGSLAEKRNALSALAALAGQAADAAVARQFDSLLAGTLPKELQLDVIEAAGKRAALTTKLAEWSARFAKDDALAPYRPALFGGDAAAGKSIFIENQQIACFRCHKINGEGGDVGPDLTGLGERKGREYLLESIVQPNKQIAIGFESVLLTMKGGAEFAGLVKSETDTELVLNSPEDGIMTLKKADVQARQRGLSAMPEEMVTFLSKRELRDIIEFLATTK